MIAPNIFSEPHPKPKGGTGVYGGINCFCATTASTWYSCREEFHAHWGKGKKLPKGFFYGATNPYLVAIMFDWVERTLNIKMEYRTKFHFCQNDVKKPLELPDSQQDGQIVFVELGEFWQIEKIRLYLSTVLCRACISSWCHPLDGILAVDYCMNTRRAIGRFLDGCTIYGGSLKVANFNWVQLFSSIEQADNLRRPFSSKELKFLDEYEDEGRVFSRLGPDEKWKICQWVRQSETALPADRPPFNF